MAIGGRSVNNWRITPTHKVSDMFRFRWYSAVFLALSSSIAYADDWVVSSGVTFHDTTSTQPGASYRDRGSSINAFASTQVEAWTLGGGLNYGLSTVDVNSGGYSRPASTSGVVMAARDIGNGRTISATLGYGNTAIDSSLISGGTTTSYTAKSSFLSSSVGLTQSIVLSRRSQVTLSVRYTGISSRSDPYTNSAGSTTPSSDASFGFASFGAGFSHRFGRFTPYISADWNVSNKDFVPNTGNKDYFSINTGLNYRLDAKTNLGLSFATTANKAYSHDNTLGASIRVSF
jgi:hypothetical protein